MSDFRLNKCKSCGVSVIWAIHFDTRGRMIFDAKPSTDGTWVLRRGLKSKVVYAKTVKPDDSAFNGCGRYVSHFATCPNAPQHRNPKTGNGTTRPNSRGDVDL